MFCPNCGKDCGDANFCPGCGKDLREKTAEQTFEEKREALRSASRAYCPKCLSTSISISGQSQRYGYHSPARSAGAVIIEALGRVMQSVHDSEYGDKCVCMNCGNEWYTKRVALQERHRDHVSKILGEYTAFDFTGIDGSFLQVSEDRVMISLSEKDGCIIPYDELAIVDHRESTDPFYGRLSIRDRAHKHRPFPKTLEAAKKDRFTILYESRFLDSYRQAYSVLKAIIEENKKAGLL